MRAPIHRLALVTAGATFLLVVAGGLVWATESALACPDWPLCHGEAFPKLSGRVFFEVGHRYVAAAVATLTALFSAAGWRRGGAARRAGLTALGLVLAQALLGGLTVLLRLPLVIRVAHLAVSQAFFASVIWAVFATREPATRAAPAAGSARALSAVAAAAVYAQLLLGAFVRHTGAGLACNAAILSCGGSFWPAAADGPAWTIRAHELFALAVAGLVVLAASRTWRESAAAPPRRLAAAAVLLVLVQVGLGLASVLSYLDVATVTAHLAAGSLLFAAVLSLRLSLAGPEAAALPIAAPARALEAA